MRFSSTEIRVVLGIRRLLAAARLTVTLFLLLRETVAGPI